MTARGVSGAFSKEIPNLQLVWDTVSTGALKTCPRYYQLSIVEGWTSTHLNPHLFFGLIVHSTREVYDRAMANGDSHDEALRAAVRYTLEAAGERRTAWICENCGRVSKQYVVICKECNTENILRRPEHFFPWESTNANKNRRTLLRTVVWYFEHYKNSIEDTVILADGKPAVELWFRFEIPLVSPDGTKYMLTGHLDRLVSLYGTRRFSDFKSTKNTVNQDFFKTFSPNNQMSQYTLGCQVVLDRPVAGGLIDAAQIAVHFTAFQRGLLERTPGQLDEWLKDIQIWIKQAEGYAIDGHWPMNDMACHHYGGCDFRGICNKDPKMRERHLRTKFTRRVWDPMQEREPAGTRKKEEKAQ